MVFRTPSFPWYQNGGTVAPRSLRRGHTFTSLLRYSHPLPGHVSDTEQSDESLRSPTGPDFNFCNFGSVNDAEQATNLSIAKQ